MSLGENEVAFKDRERTNKGRYISWKKPLIEEEEEEEEDEGGEEEEEEEEGKFRKNQKMLHSGEVRVLVDIRKKLKINKNKRKK